MLKILIQVSEPYSRPSLKPGEYVDVALCKQIDFYGNEITEATSFRPVHTYGPVGLNDLRAYLLGLQDMARVTSPDDQFTVEVPPKLHPQILGVENLKEVVTHIAS